MQMATEYALKHEAGFAEGFDQIESQIAEFDLNQFPSTRDGFKEITIPIVVHVLYRLEEHNISYEQIASQIDVLNRDFNLLNADQAKIPDVFRSVAGKAKFTFKLANTDPYGNFTTGVTRTKTDVEYIADEMNYHKSSQGGKTPWNQALYLNIWVCEIKGGTLGWSILPGSNISERDGIVMSPRAFGTMGTAIEPYNGGRTLVHEMGHYFGLRHLWGSDDEACGFTDYMSDTPEQRSENFGCKEFPHYSCDGEPNGDMFMNYMDYGNDTCMLFFTERQVAYMQLIVKTVRRALFYSQGVTGVNDHLPSEIKLYPNPVLDQLHVELETREEIRIYNALGALVYVGSDQSLIQQVDVSDWSSGVYYVHAGEHVEKLIVGK